MPLEEGLEPTGRAVAHVALPFHLFTHPSLCIRICTIAGGRGRERGHGKDTRKGPRTGGGPSAKLGAGTAAPPLPGGGTTAVPARDTGPGQGRSASAASLEAREPLRKSVTPTRNNLPDPC
ncbi:hypothetical protein GCM10010497_48180 [Streptomyces cinereoruber]|uniref:Uncharacterized protein n=1 Tax=Streptomyces cinereoruber TaxID=67260 RepID=A0AAV4KS98_9ACTN|nr:hypothetical protein GCM10010497_48180 [Streptomyces cinereoruber]